MVLLIQLMNYGMVICPRLTSFEGGIEEMEQVVGNERVEKRRVFGAITMLELEGDGGLTNEDELGGRI